jgi:hypothetical protein
VKSNTKLKLVVSNKPPVKRKKPAPTVSTRPFLTTYAGMWCGHCKTRESAILAAVKRVVNDGYLKATITDTTTNQDVVRIRVNAARTQAIVDTVKPLKGKIGL